jgi:ubiquinone/menaquinone biosynthesis C-methylase UbiE
MRFYANVIFPRLCDWLLGQSFIARHRRELLARAHGDVLEIGFGTGLNLFYYPERVRRLTALDPNPGMRRLARRRIARSRIAVQQQVASGQQLPFADRTFDCVVSTFTLCSVADVGQVLREVVRVLKPTGSFLFLEHGLSPDPAVQRWQRRLNRLEQWLADGCNLDRPIAALVAAQPFATVAVDAFYLEHVPPTHGYLYQGVARCGETV